MTASSDQTMVADSSGIAVRRIRNPNPQDVLCGRGGGINSHAGNVTFRQWVNERKSDYNLAQNKREKIDVAIQVVHQVQTQTPTPGRFLMKDPTIAASSNGLWWVEVDEAKALAKTTQALREGAPKIREALQNQEGSPRLAPKVPKKRKRKASATAAEAEVEPGVTINIDTPLMDDAAERQVLQTVQQDASSLPRYKSEQLLLPSSSSNLASALEELQENVKKAKHAADQQRQQVQVVQVQTQPRRQPPQSISPIAPLTSNKAFKEMYIQQQQTVPNRNSQFNPLLMPAIDPLAETPPLVSAPEPAHANEIPHLSLNGGGGPPNGQPPKRARLRRVHSLALSDCDGDLTIDFVNPFADESNVFGSSKSNEPTGAFKSHETSSVPDQVAGDNTFQTPRLNHRSAVNGYLNRLLSFSSTPQEDGDTQSHLIKDDEADENRLNRSNSDYFFHDAVPDGDRGEGMKTIMDVVHPNTATQDQNVDSNKSSSSLVPRWGGGSSANSLIRRSSFSASRGRGLVNPGRQQ